MRNTGVGSWIARWARNAPRRVALIAKDRAWTYEEVAARVRRLANALRALGIRRGDRVAWTGPNHAAFLETFFAAGTLGAVLVTINHRREKAAIARILEDAGASQIVSYGPSDRVRIGESDYESLVASASDAPIDEPVGSDDLCMLPYTSGTTGDSKGVMLTHGNVTWNAVNVLLCADIRGNDVTIAIAPFFRVGGTGVNVLPLLFKGGCVVIPTSSEPAELLALIERQHVTVGFGNPDLLDAMLLCPRWSSTDLSRVRFFMTGGAPVPERMIRAYLERGVTLLQGYGLSETSPVALLLDPANALKKVGSAGRPPLLVDVRIVRRDGSPAGTGETGELHVHGPNVMTGYWKLPDATRAAIDCDGWVRTGDLARMDEEGDVWIVDRAGDEYVSMGEVVYPGDVERVLLDHPAVRDAGVVGLSGAGAAFVVLASAATATESELLEHCRRTLPAHAVPSKLSFLSSIPRNSVGKLLRRELKKQLTKTTTDEEIQAYTIGELKPLTAPIVVADYDPNWPALFEREAARIRSILGDRVKVLEHAGSTSVPGLSAKPIIDIVLAVPDSSDESTYVPPLELAGYVLRIREPHWFEHRVLKGPDTDVNLHVFTVGCEEINHMLLFRDWLRGHPKDRDRYAMKKLELAKRQWKFVQNYADAKTEIVEDILTRARADAASRTR